MIVSVAAGLAATAVASFLVTGLIRRYAETGRLVDEPGARSSHSVPTPRGGGIAIAVTVLVALITIAITGLVPVWPATAFALGAGIVTLIGWLDDHGGVAPGWRLAVHLVSGALLVAAAGPPALPLPGVDGLLDGWFGGVVAVLGLAWLINLYNFMDGTDALAATEAVTVGGVGASLLLWGGLTGWAVLAASIAAAAGGFLMWNRPPARIFLGDSGSGFLGFSLGGLALAPAPDGTLPGWVWLILLGVFIVDASLTLARRAMRGERVHEAHRSHAYQRAARLAGRHGPVAVTTAGINLAWLAPLAWLAASRPVWGLALTGIAWLPLAGVCLWLGAGKRE